jgi:shikimate dehydrogenase
VPAEYIPNILCGLVGMDIQSSRSPAMHMREADSQGLRLIYRLFDLGVAGSSDDDLPLILDAVERTGFSGVNVTHPFKQRVIPLLHDLSDEARAIGAVNTVLFRDGRRIGHNTDWSGFAEGFERQLGGANVGRVLQVGAGGAGAATAMAILNLGCKELVIVDPQADRAQALADRFADHGSGAVVRAATDIASEIAQADGVINATPIGMEGHSGSPVDTGLLHPALWVADVVYFPLETQLLREARAIGCRTANGGGMAIFQAARAFDLFTGLIADRERMVAHF